MVTVFLVFIGAGVILDGDAFDGLDHPEVAGEAFASCRTPFVPVQGHPFGICSEQGVEQVIRIAGEQRPGQAQKPSRRSVEHAQCIALSGITGELMDFIRNGVIEPFRHVTTHIFRRCHADDLASVGLPKWAVFGRPILRQFCELVQAFLVKIDRRKAHSVRLNRRARIGVRQRSQVSS